MTTAHIAHPEDSEPTAESDWLADWLARRIRTLRRPIAAPDRWLTYYPICLALVGVLSLITGASILLGPALGTPAEGILGLILGTLYLAVSVGLAERRRWAWRVNYWGLLLVQPITVAVPAADRLARRTGALARPVVGAEHALLP